MELLQLRYFSDAAETENFSLTAKKFGVPASDISQSIKRLERELQTKLFERRANRIFLNEKGACFYKKAKEALALLDSAASEVSDDGRSGKINICINCNRRIVMHTIEKFCSRYPEVDIMTRYGVYSNHEEFNLIISSEPAPSPGFSGEKIITEKLCLAVNNNSPLAADEHIDPKQLANESFITMDENSNLHKATREIFADLGFSPRLAIQAGDPLYVIKCVELGLGVAVVPTVSWRGQFPDNVTLKKLGNCSRDIYIFKNENKYVSKSTNVFLQMLREEFHSELESATKTT